ncbi:MAG: hypothetical protein KBT03_06815 [Bacteroidales bacterium]|nr:hypothetical protein [Candidatus Scybalousia scybalohippi]
MAVANSVKGKSYANEKQILVAPELAFTIGCLVGNTGVAANAEGKKIIKAGTPVGGTTDVLTNRQTVLTKGAENAQGVVMHDVDVTDGDGRATLVVSGYVDLYKLDSDVVTVVNSAKSALTKITFLNGSKN